MSIKIKTQNRMKTLQKFIDDGLPVGALVNVYELINETTFQWNGKIFTCVSIPDPWYQFGDSILEDDYSTLEAEPTTAYDSRIDPETLPISEPFWTGWAMCPYGTHEIIEFVEGEYWQPQGFDDEGYQEPNYFKFKDGSGCYEYECQPCLPPA